MSDIKQKILKELQSNFFPNLEFLYSKEVLDISLDLLEELLEIDKKNFEKLIKIPYEKLSFDSFEEESLLDYFWSLLNHYKNVNSNEQIRNIIENFRPKIEDFWNYVAYNKPYYKALLYVNKNLELDLEQKRIMHLRIKSFKDRWISLSKQKQEELKKINLELSKLADLFDNNIIDDEKGFEYIINNIDDIKNLPKEVLQEAKNKALKKNEKWYLFDSDPTSTQAIMKYCDSVKIRKYFETKTYSVASKWKFDNRKIILKLLKLKLKKAKMLWYNNFAELSLNKKMAESPKQVTDLIEWISAKAKVKAKKEIQELKKYFKINKINSYDLAYYSRKYKEEKYSIDEKKLKQYFEFNNSLDYLFEFASNFYWITMKKLDVKTYSEDVLVYEVYKNKKLISYFFLDPFYHNLKMHWAWANTLRHKTYLWKNPKVPIIYNVCNFQKTKWKITLYIRDVETIFHEFWHALHKMLSESKYSELWWANVEWDFIEVPSQITENWVSEKESMSLLAKHYKTNKTLDLKTLDKLEKLKTFMSWCFVVRQNEFALVDMSIYQMKIPKSIDKLDENILKLVNKYSFFKRRKNYKMYCSFSHIFWWWYAAWYYSYMWAEILEADIFEKIKQMWMFDFKTWEKFVKTILWQWTRKKASELFFDFMWREVDDKAFLKRKWI